MGGAAREEPILEIDAWLGLSELHLDLADSLETLAPFGAGNPEIILATRDVNMKSMKEIGKTREHRRIVISDESGTEQDLLWWNGAGEEFPEAETKFDIAYSLRAGMFRGQRQLTLQFEEYRIVKSTPVEIQKPGIEIRDWRSDSGKIDAIRARALVWAEGSDQSKGVTRYNLHQADEFAIYTAPPSPAELRRAMEIVRPNTIHVFALAPAEEKPEEFLNRLAGLCKYALNQRNGRAGLQELTAAMASRESAVQIGLEWLAAGGQLTIRFGDDQIELSSEKQERNPYVQAELYIALRGLLEESLAYHKFLASTENLNALIIQA
ncbi:MAG: hypothetical protein HGA45_23950 [Chloroflexales bacterium]|nr:hypothetical protein [Chloroflexales bacterium]